jgi:hypothetical protein
MLLTVLIFVFATPGHGTPLKDEEKRLKNWRLGYGKGQVLSGAPASVKINDQNYSGRERNSQLRDS